jgi:hypothetical protein
LYGSKRPRSISADIAFSVVNLKTVPCWNFRCRIGDLAESEHDRLMNAIPRAFVGRVYNGIQLPNVGLSIAFTDAWSARMSSRDLLDEKACCPIGSPGGARHQPLSDYTLQ